MDLPFLSILMVARRSIRFSTFRMFYKKQFLGFLFIQTSHNYLDFSFKGTMAVSRILSVNSSSSVADACIEAASCSTFKTRVQLVKNVFSKRFKAIIFNHVNFSKITKINVNYIINMQILNCFQMET